MAQHRRLSTEILRLQVVILIGTLVIGLGLSLTLLYRNLVHQYEERVLAIASTVAADPQIAAAVLNRDPTAVQPRAEAVRRATGALFVVVTDGRGIRYSHPDPDEIGHRVSTDPSEALSGHTVVAVERGTLGLSARAKVPLRSAEGQVIGEVSVGIAASEVHQRLLQLLPTAAAYSALALLLGVLGSFALSRRLKRRTFGLELDEIASLLREREAMLHGVREGVLTLDPTGRITLLNDEARRLLTLDSSAVGSRLEAEIAPGRLRSVLTGEVGGVDETVLTDDYCLVVNRMPVAVGGRPLGAVVTLRDRTEQEGLLRELDNVRGLTDALRAQQHEFANRLHTLAGLLELGHDDDAHEYALDLTHLVQGHQEELARRICDPFVVALLLAKTATAGERGVQLLVDADTRLDQRSVDADPLLTVLGNLIDNAVDSAAIAPAPRWVNVRMGPAGDQLLVEVHDSGPGIPAGAEAEVFTDGYSTKSPNGPARRGLGLALVRRMVHRLGGSIEVTAGPGARFTVRLPLPVDGRRQLIVARGDGRPS